MKIKELMPNVKPSTFIEDYMLFCGIEERDFSHFLRPDLTVVENPMNYTNMQKGYDILENTVMNNGKIGLVMHLDMDSMLSNVIMYQYLIDINPSMDIQVFFPKVKPQGLNKVVLKEILDSDVDLLILTDACSSDVEELKLFDRLNQLGWKRLDCIICDHHAIAKGKSGAENYSTLINNQVEKDVVNKSGSGTLVTWKFMQYIDYICGTSDSEKYIDLVAMSLVSDACDTRSLENRFVLTRGLSNIRNSLLLEATRAFTKDGDSLSIESLGWSINPKFNGIIKSGDVDSISSLFYAFVDPEREATWEQGTKRITHKKGLVIEKVLYLLKTLGDNKKDVLHQAYNEIKDTIDENEKVAIVYGGDLIPFSMGGDFANKVSGETGKPCICFMPCDSDGYYTGSCRSKVPLKKLMQDSGLFVFADGHDSAFGIKIKKENVEKLKDYISTLNLESDVSYTVIKSYEYTNIPPSIFNAIQPYLDCFGKGFEVPLFHIKGIRINAKDIMVMGKQGVTFKFYKNGVCYIKFFANKQVKEDFMIGEDVELSIDIVGKFMINEFNGSSTNQVIIDKYEISIVDVKEKKEIESWEDLW